MHKELPQEFSGTAPIPAAKHLDTHEDALQLD